MNKIYLILFAFLILLIYSITSRLYEKTIYVSIKGNDNNSGTYDKPLRSIQHALNLATPGTTIHILPGIYRESVRVPNSGTKESPITLYVAPADRGKTVLAGSEPSSEMTWTRCTNNTCNEIPANIRNEIFFTELDWIESPYQIYEITSGQEIHELYMARTPNYNITNDWKFHENWWTAQDSTENDKILSDNLLKKVGDITGAIIHMIDGGSRCGEISYTRIVNNFNKNKGEITFNQPVGFSIFGSQENGLSKYTKYYLENKPQFLDKKGEWYFDRKSKILYVWPIEEKNPKNLNIEIPKRSAGVDLSNVSNFAIDGLTIRYINAPDSQSSNSGGAIIIMPKKNSVVQNISFSGLEIDHSSSGIAVSAPYQTSKIDHISLTKSRIEYIDKSVFIADSASQSPSNITNILISDSDFGFSSFQNNDIGLSFTRVGSVKLHNNKFHNFANYPIIFTGFERNNGMVKDISIENNFINNSCLNLSACSSIKIYGGKFVNTIIENNILENNRGWSYCQETKYGGGYAHGIFISNASGITIQKNIITNISDIGIEVYPRQIPTVNNHILNNLIGYTSTAINLGNPKDSFDLDKLTHDTRHDGDIIKNNIFLDNNTGINIDPANTANVKIDYNAYIGNQNDMILRNSPLKKVGDIHTTIPFWDAHSIDTIPQALKNVGKSDFNLYYTSPLRGRGEPQSDNSWFQANLYLLGLANDIGPCKFSWTGNTCPVIGN